jgi:HEAT repeat protein
LRRAAPEEVGEAVVYWLACYSRSPTEAARQIRDLAVKAPGQVVETALRLYQAGTCGEGARFLAGVLSSEDSTVEKLCDPSTSLEGSVCAAKALMQHETRFDLRFAKSLLSDDQLTEAARQRGLAILQRLGSGDRLVPILIQFLRDPDSRIRSKTALMFGQIMSTRGIMDQLFGDEDARVRANFLEGLWNGPGSFDCRPLFLQAMDDSNHRVAANALVGLHRLGESGSVVGHVTKMAEHPEGSFRAAAAWVMGQTGDKRHTPALRGMVRDPDPRVRFNALRSLRRINLANAAGDQGGPPAPAATT